MCIGLLCRGDKKGEEGSMSGHLTCPRSWTLTAALLRRIFVVQAVLVVFAGTTSSFDDFRFTVEPSDIVAVRGESALLNCSASYSGRTPQMQWIRDGVYMNFEGDGRRYKLDNGSLHFTSIMHTRSHRPDEGVYQCVASISDIGTIVSRKAKLQVAYLDRDFEAQPQNLVVHLGDTAMLACNIDGAPKPTVRWYRDEMEIFEQRNINYRVHNDGVLEISNVQFTDLGRYKCKVENVERSRTSEAATLEQNSDSSTYQGVKPFFIMTPKSKIALEGTTVMLYCGANGRDRQGRLPKIMWLKDGITIDMANLDSRFSIVGQGSLQIVSAQAADAGAYTCRATNLEDSMDTDAVLTVHVSPRFLRRPKHKFAHVNKDIEFGCDVYGIPKPTITWTKNGDVVIPSDYFQIIEGKNLRILGLVNSDAGIYQCFGDNEVGNIQTSAQLTVLKPGQTEVARHQLPSAPRNLEAAIVSRRFVTLSWNLPDRSGPSEIIAYSVFWKETNSDRERVMNTTQPEANIQHLKPATKYEFRVLAYNRLGPGQNMAEISVTTQPDVLVPNPATNLHAVATSPTSIFVSWNPPAAVTHSGGEILYYMLNYYQNGDKEEKNVTVHSGTSYLLTDLKAFTEYRFRVVAFNKNGMGMSTEEVVTRTYSDVPSTPPKNITIETSSSKSIILRWEPVDESHRNGVITGYKIRYKRTNSRGKTVTTDSNRRTYALIDLQKGTKYLVRISALTVNGSGPASEWLTGETFVHDLDETQVPGQPSSLRTRPFPNSIVVSWTPPLEQDVMIRGYRLGYGIGIPDEYRHMIDAKQRYYTIKNLKPSSEYVISLRAFNNKGEGRPIYETQKTREETHHEPVTLMSPPLGLKAIVLSASTIVVTWSDTTLGYNQRITDNRYYTVKYYARGQNKKPRYINSTDLNVHVDNLKPSTEYEFSVKVLKGRRHSTWSLSVLNKTFEAVPSSAPRDLTPVSVEGHPSWVALNWQPPRLPNGQITGYVVFYTTDNSLADRSWVVDAVMGGDKLSTTIMDLSADTTYYFKVQARNSKGYGPTSPTVIFRTPKADGTGGGKIDTIFDLEKKNTFNEAKANEKEGKGGLSSMTLWIIISCIGGAALIAIVVLVFFLCRRRGSGGYGKRQGSAAYTKGKQSKGPSGVKDLKPPDLWIHHEMELKNMEKGRNQDDCQDEKDDASMELMEKRRNSFVKDHGYESHEEPEERYQRRPIRTKPIMIPVDAQPQPPREPIATAMAIPNGHILGSQQSHQPEIPARPVYPRTQYSTQYASNPPRVHMGDSSGPSSDHFSCEEYNSESFDKSSQPLLSQNGITGPQSPDSPCSSSIHAPIPYEELAAQYSPTQEGCPSQIQRPMHPLKSFSVPEPPQQSCPTTPPPKHIVRPQQTTSPYKKPPPAAVMPMKARSPMPVATPMAPDAGPDDDCCELQKTYSTEELSAEMANLEGLMKDLSAITQQEFEC